MRRYSGARSKFYARFCRAVLAVCLSSSWALWPTPGAAQQDVAVDAAFVAGYVAEVDDLPLMPGLRQLLGAGLVFDKPSGRIVEVYAQGEVRPEAVRAFYARSLPPLGWQVAGEAAFRRDGEILLLEFVTRERPLLVRFSLRPD
jgi:hypothetical protein